MRATGAHKTEQMTLNNNQKKLVHERFLEMANQFASRPAIRFSRDGIWQDWSYGSLAGRVLTIRQRLVNENVRPGDAVGLVSYRHPDTIAAMIAILSTGAHYVPLDPHYPSSRLDFLIGEAGIRVVLAAPEQTLDLSNLPMADRLVEDRAPAAADDASALAELQLSADDPAYIMFTSGSTGTPKGVLVPHRGLYRHAVDVHCWPLGPQSVFLQLAPMTFDASNTGIWSPLLNGGICVLFPEDMVPTRFQLESVVRDTGVNYVFLTTQLFNNTFSSEEGLPATVKYVMTGGEAASVNAFRRGLRAMPNSTFLNGYGPTENTSMTTCYEFPKDFPEDATKLPIGTPVSGSDVIVVDQDLNPVPVGTEGELVALGEGVALGYLNRPDLTAKSFVSLTTADGSLHKGYRTGDKVRVGEDGNIEFLGRFDEQVKIAGYRIEPGEIETHIGRFDGVSGCRVLARKAPDGQVRLVAYVVCADPDVKQNLRRMLAAEIPVYMVPQYFYFMDSLPVNTNGKLDVKSLPDPFADIVACEESSKDEALGTIKSAWVEILGTSPASNDTNLFDAGGTSLDAVRLHELLCGLVGQDLDSTFVFENPTIHRQAEALRARSATENSAADRGARRRAARTRRVRANIQ